MGRHVAAWGYVKTCQWRGRQHFYRPPWVVVMLLIPAFLTDLSPIMTSCTCFWFRRPAESHGTASRKRLQLLNAFWSETFGLLSGFRWSFAVSSSNSRKAELSIMQKVENKCRSGKRKLICLGWHSGSGTRRSALSPAHGCGLNRQPWRLVGRKLEIRGSWDGLTIALVCMMHTANRADQHRPRWVVHSHTERTAIGLAFDVVQATTWVAVVSCSHATLIRLGKPHSNCETFIAPSVRTSMQEVSKSRFIKTRPPAWVWCQRSHKLIFAQHQYPTSRLWNHLDFGAMPRFRISVKRQFVLPKMWPLDLL